MLKAIKTATYNCIGNGGSGDISVSVEEVTMFICVSRISQLISLLHGMIRF
jgi:hypothetical protein